VGCKITADSIKSLEGFRIAWIDEAQSLSARSLALLRPTIRAPDSELWASWNPRRKSDAIDDFFRTRKPDGAILVHANWRDNPWFPRVLDDERKTDLALYPDRYAHIDVCAAIPMGVSGYALLAQEPHLRSSFS
jgi:phage terminase large subunit